jgi:hypothetical protein
MQVSDNNLRYQKVSIAVTEVGASAWTEIAPGSNTGKMIIRGEGAFKLADSSSPAGHFMIIASGVSLDYESGANVYANAPVATVLQVLRYS